MQTGAAATVEGGDPQPLTLGGKPVSQGLMAERLPLFGDKEGSVLNVEMTVKTRGFTALKTEACGLTQEVYLHF